MEIKDYKVIEPFLGKLERLKSYIEHEDIELTDLADAYLQISRLIYYVLKECRSDLGKLREGYTDLLDVIQKIQLKKTKDEQIQKLTTEELRTARRLEDKEAILNNKNNVNDVLGLYVNTIQNLEQNILGKSQIKKMSIQNWILFGALLTQIFFTIIDIVLRIYKI